VRFASAAWYWISSAVTACTLAIGCWHGVQWVRRSWASWRRQVILSALLLSLALVARAAKGNPQVTVLAVLMAVIVTGVTQASIRGGDFDISRLRYPGPGPERFANPS
jgi:hypothetical protein